MGRTRRSGSAWSKLGQRRGGVDIFFIISGFVMVISSRRLVDRPGAWLIFLRHRVVRIVPLYWLLTTAKIVAVMVLGVLS